MGRRSAWRAVIFGWLWLATMLVASPSRAAPYDAAATATVNRAMTEDYPGNLGPAKKKLQDALAGCSRRGCSGPVRAQIHIGLGMIASQLGQAEEALGNFTSAFQADPKAKLPSSGTTPTIRAQWEQVTPKPVAPPPVLDVPPPGPSGDEPPAPPPASGKAPPGWASAEAFKLAVEGLKAGEDNRLDECIEKDKASLKIEDQPRTRLHLASCENRAGKIVDALKDAQKALESGIKKRDSAVMKSAQTRVKDLIERIPHVTFVPPAGVPDLSVKFDDRAVPTESLTKKFSVDPGKHTVVAGGTVNGFTATFEQEIEIKEAELVAVQITLKPPASEVITPGQIKCMLAAKSQEEVQKCLPQNRKNLVVRLGANFSAYGDTNHVNVLTPGINASLVSPTAGWNVGANYILDVVSAASPDIVSEASPPYRESRSAVGVTGGYKPGLFGAQGTFDVSSEPDYLSITGGIALTADLNDKLVTPRVGYSYSHDQIGRGPSNWLHDIEPNKGILNTQEIEAGITFVMSPTAILLVSGTMQFERGDQSKPYRYVPMFDPINVAPYVPVGATIDLVNRTRLPVRPTEQLPTERDRYAIGGRYVTRLGNATLRVDERLYIDTWGTKASSTDGRYLVDLSRHLRVWPHMRLHAQSGANFYQLAYSAYTGPNGMLVVPTYRSGDRELSPIATVTAGGGARIGLGSPEGESKYGIDIAGDLMYTRFFNSLFVTARTAVYGTVGFDVEF